MSEHLSTHTIHHKGRLIPGSYESVLAAPDETLRDTLEPVSGGYSGAIRGIYTTDRGERLFVKRGTSPATVEAYQREAEVYGILTGYPLLPRLYDANETTLVLQDLSDRDFTDTWTPDKLTAAFAAMESLARLPADGRLERFSLKNGWEELALQPHLMDALRHKMGDDFDPAIDIDLVGRAQAVEAFLDSPGVVSHGDVRGDNFAYDPSTQTGMFVDWNWCGIAPASKDTTELMVSVAESGFPLTEEMIREHCSAEACLMLAGYWFSQCVQPAWPGGEGVREHQYVSARIAWEWHKGLSEELPLNS